jgi:hypothetical protein
VEDDDDDNEGEDEEEEAEEDVDEDEDEDEGAVGGPPLTPTAVTASVQELVTVSEL